MSEPGYGTHELITRMREFEDVVREPIMFRGTELIPIDGGYRIVETDEYVIDVMKMIYNWRVCVSLPEWKDKLFERGYCYFGTGPDTFIRAVAAAQQWTDPFNTDPIGFDKRAF